MLPKENSQTSTVPPPPIPLLPPIAEEEPVSSRPALVDRGMERQSSVPSPTPDPVFVLHPEENPVPYAEPASDPLLPVVLLPPGTVAPNGSYTPRRQALFAASPPLLVEEELLGTTLFPITVFARRRCAPFGIGDGEGGRAEAARLGGIPDTQYSAARFVSYPEAFKHSIAES